ncbi:MAG TPA: alpha/beta hydrolase [Frankiaceae bacterium]|nr:alpha/beta hydrolase [Frankiaceae bacterium]
MTTFVTRDGVTLSYTTRGNGPLLVCQPGGPGRASRYLGDLGGLDATRTLLLLDARGTGASGRTERLAMPYLAGDLEDLRAHLGVERFDLLAHSAGAVVAQVFARQHPVGRLVLVTPSGRLQDVTGEDVSRPETYGTWNAAAQAHAAHVDEEMDRRAECGFYDFGDVPRGTIDAETLVVAGGADRLTPVAAAEAIAAEIPRTSLVVLDGVGHYPWVESPSFAAIVEEFLT